MSGFILLHHPVHESITDEEMRVALAAAGFAGVPAIPVRIQPAKLSLAETLHANWGELCRAQERLVVERLETILEEHADYELAYFGLAPISLAIHLGSVVDRWRRARIFQRHHRTHVWSWADGAATTVVDVATAGLPQDVVRSDDDVVIRVSVTAHVDAAESAKVVALPSAEIDIAVPAPGEDVLKTAADLEAVAGHVKVTLDRLKTHRPNARYVHLFAAVPTGLAFRLGTLVSSTQHHRVQTYQYFHTADPRQRRAILLRDDGPRRNALTDADRAGAQTVREAWAGDVGRVKGFAASLAGLAKRSPDDCWYGLLGMPPEPWSGAWRALPAFHETAMAVAGVDTLTTAVEGGFRYEQARDAWLVGDELVAAIRRRLTSPDDQARAGRMLFFHEALHIASHRLTEATAPAIRRFPKILEAVDYEADVWAMLHELAFTKHFHPGDAGSEREVFLDIAKTAVETMWAFDDAADELERMEIRRVNRYLIWYWQILRLERCASLEAIAKVLSRKPLIELAGPRVHVDGDRVFYELRPPWATDLELAAQLDHNGIVRHGRAAATNTELLLDGLRQRNGDKIRLVIKGIVDQEVAR